MMFVISNTREPQVIIDWQIFKMLLEASPESLLIELFAEDILLEKEWKKLTKDNIVNQIFINYEN